MIDQGELFEIPNPCRGVCTANNRGYCKGCLRSRIERQHWYELTPHQQQQVINLCERRRQKILAGPAEAAPEEETDISQLDLFIADTVAEQVENEHKEEQQASVTEITDASSVPEPSPPPEPPATKNKGDQFDLF